MPRQARLDAPGVLHHVTVQGRNRGPSFRVDVDRGHLQLVREGLAQGRRADLVGGGLLRRLGGWSQVLAGRRKRLSVASDARILGSGDFTEHRLAEAARHDKEPLRLSRGVIELVPLARTVSAGQGVAERELRSGSLRPAIVRARGLFCPVAVQGMGSSGARVAAFLGVTTSAVNQLAVAEEFPEVQQYLKAL